MPISPSWLLLLWTGLAAFLIAAAVVTPLAGDERPRGSLLYLRPAHRADWAVLVALAIAYPIMYGLIFDYIHVANALAGFAMGLLHATLLIAGQGLRRTPPRQPAATLLAYTVYGTVLGFLYVTP